MHTTDSIQKNDPAMVQKPAGYADIKTLHSKFIFDEKEKEILRKLAKQVAFIALRQEMKRKAALWTAHNDLKTDIPPVFIDPENGWNELIPPKALECREPLARVWEMQLRKQIFWGDCLKDDRVIEMYFDVPYSFTDTGWGIDPEMSDVKYGDAYQIKKSIENYEEDFKKLHDPQIKIDRIESDKILEAAHRLFDDILIVRRKHYWWWTLGLNFDYVFLRGMEEFMCDFVLEPEWVHRMYNLLCEGKLHLLKFLEENHLLSINTGATYVGSGGFGFTSELPGPEKTEGVATADMWGFCDAQETAQMSPEMYAEFILPYHTKILDRFGLSCYGCCEGYDKRWKYVKQLPHLRRVSVSPWANWDTVPEYLGKNYIASVKPNPALLALKEIDEEAVRSECKRAVRSTKGGICEFIMKDNNTLGNNPANAVRWVEIMREEIEKQY